MMKTHHQAQMPSRYLTLLTLYLLTLAQGKQRDETRTGIGLSKDRNILVSASGAATIAQICSSKTGKISSLCRPCVCNQAGSESPTCDKYSRRCKCRIGFTGSKCNNCSRGYFNSTTIPATADTQQNSIPIQTTWKCASCGQCFHQWRENVTSLKELTIHLIERASKLDQSFMDLLGVSSSQFTGGKLTFEGKRTSFSDIDHSLKKIGNHILEAKQRSDHLNSLSSEINSTLAAFLQVRSNLGAQQELSVNLEEAWQRFNYKIQLQYHITSDLLAKLQNFKRDLLHVQELTLEDSIKLIRMNSNRTRQVSGKLQKLDRQFAHSLEETIRFLMNKQESISFSQKQMKFVASKIFNESIPSNLLESSSVNQSGKLTLQETFDFQLFHEQTTTLTSSAKSIADLAAQKFDSYSASYENRSLEMLTIREEIEQIKATLMLAEQELTLFKDNISSMEQLMAPGNDPSSRYFAHLLGEAAQMIRANLDKIEFKWDVAQSHYADLKAQSLKLNETSQLFTNLTSEVNQALKMSRPSLMQFKGSLLQAGDLKSVTDLKSRSQLLADHVNKLGKKLSKLSEIKRQRSDFVENTKEQTIRIKIEADRIIRLTSEPSANLNLTGFKTKSHTNALLSCTHLADSRSLAKSPTLDANGVLDRARTYRTKSLRHEMLFEGLIKEKIERLNNLTRENGELANALNQRLTELSDCEIAMTNVAGPGSNGTTSKSRADKLRNWTRMTNVMTGLKQISVYLYQDLARTRNVHMDFVESQRLFAEQQVTIDALHRELDLITVDLKKTKHERCPPPS